MDCCGHSQLDSLPLVISIPSCPSSHHEALRIFWWNTVWSLQLLAEATFPTLFVSDWNVSFQMPMSLSKGQWSMIKVQPHYQVFSNSHHHSVTPPSFVCYLVVLWNLVVWQTLLGSVRNPMHNCLALFSSPVTLGTGTTRTYPQVASSTALRIWGELMFVKWVNEYDVICLRNHCQSWETKNLQETSIFNDRLDQISWNFLL